MSRRARRLVEVETSGDGVIEVELKGREVEVDIGGGGDRGGYVARVLSVAETDERVEVVR
jgi:hypothetical protein